jgi:hypothetical protein
MKKLGAWRLAWGFGAAGKMPAVTGLDVIVSKTGKLEALYTFLDPAQKLANTNGTRSSR